jgi:hypothetical protein
LCRLSVSGHFMAAFANPMASLAVFISLTIASFTYCPHRYCRINYIVVGDCLPHEVVSGDIADSDQIAGDVIGLENVGDGAKARVFATRLELSSDRKSRFHSNIFFPRFHRAV